MHIGAVIRCEIFKHQVFSVPTFSIVTFPLALSPISPPIKTPLYKTKWLVVSPGGTIISFPFDGIESFLQELKKLARHKT